MKKYQIFLSSTYEDLKSERDAIQRVIFNMRHIPMGMEQFNASNASQWEIIQENIRSSDYLVLIVGFHYGSLTESGISFTEAEFDYAVSQGVPVLAFIKDESVPLLHQYYDDDQIPIKNFRKKVLTNRVCQYWSSEADLIAKVPVALASEFERCPRSGWSRSQNDIRNNFIKLAQTCRKTNRQEALRYYKSALEIDPSYVDAHRELAGTYFDLQDYESAAHHFRQTAKVSQADWTYFCIGLSYERMKEYKMAWDFYLKTWILNPDYSGIKDRLDVCKNELTKQGNPPPVMLQLP
ncbi:MAG: DUF4062 domain-containing protein [Oscillibacter sp.]|nr:DUF4062 domain-containing protein [Oscillibacter sp.]